MVLLFKNAGEKFVAKNYFQVSHLSSVSKITRNL